MQMQMFLIRAGWAQSI